MVSHERRSTILGWRPVEQASARDSGWDGGMDLPGIEQLLQRFADLSDQSETFHEPQGAGPISPNMSQVSAGAAGKGEGNMRSAG